jgi:hypothetical protein
VVRGEKHRESINLGIMNGCVQRAARNGWKDWFSLICFVADLPGYLASWINEGERKKERYNVCYPGKSGQQHPLTVKSSGGCLSITSLWEY